MIVLWGKHVFQKLFLGYKSNVFHPAHRKHDLRACDAYQPKVLYLAEGFLLLSRLISVSQAS